MDRVMGVESIVTSLLLAVHVHLYLKMSKFALQALACSGFTVPGGYGTIATHHQEARWGSASIDAMGIVLVYIVLTCFLVES